MAKVEGIYTIEEMKKIVEEQKNMMDNVLKEEVRL